MTVRRANKVPAANSFDYSTVRRALQQDVRSLHAIGDFNRDGRPDILIGNQMNGVATLFQRRSVCRPTIVRFRNAHLPRTCLPRPFVPGPDRPSRASCAMVCGCASRAATGGDCSRSTVERAMTSPPRIARKRAR